MAKYRWGVGGVCGRGYIHTSDLNIHTYLDRPPPTLNSAPSTRILAICLRGALPPVDLRAVCLVRAMVDKNWDKMNVVFQPTSNRVN